MILCSDHWLQSLKPVSVAQRIAFRISKLQLQVKVLLLSDFIVVYVPLFNTKKVLQVGQRGSPRFLHLHLPSLSRLTSQNDHNNKFFYRGSGSDVTSQLVSRFADIRTNSFHFHNLTFSKLIVKILWQTATIHRLTGFNHSNTH